MEPRLARFIRLREPECHKEDVSGKDWWKALPSRQLSEADGQPLPARRLSGGRPPPLCEWKGWVFTHFLGRDEYEVKGKQFKENGVIRNDEIWLVVRSLKNAEGKIVSVSLNSELQTC